MKTPIPFVIDLEPKVWWPVSVMIPVDAGYAQRQFEAFLRVYSEEEYEQLLNQKVGDRSLKEILADNAGVLPKFVTDWRGVTDPSGAALPISALPAILTGPYGKEFSQGIYQALGELRYGKEPGSAASAKNSAPPPAAGSTASEAAVEEPTI